MRDIFDIEMSMIEDTVDLVLITSNMFYYLAKIC